MGSAIIFFHLKMTNVNGLFQGWLWNGWLFFSYVYGQFIIKKHTPFPAILLSLHFLSECCHHCSRQDIIIDLWIKRPLYIGKGIGKDPDIFNEKLACLFFTIQFWHVIFDQYYRLFPFSFIRSSFNFLKWVLGVDITSIFFLFEFVQ